MRILFAGLFVLTCGYSQPPLIYNRAVLNAASFMPPSLPGGAIAQGSIFSIFGTRLGPMSPAQANAFPLGTTLGGISITITQGSSTVNAIPLFVSDGQINAIMPSNAPAGFASMRIMSGNIRSNPMTVRIATSAFGIFTATGTGIGPGILTNFVSAGVQPVNSPTITAEPGQTMTLYGTGLGPVQADNVAAAGENLAIKVEVFVGGVSATPLYSGRAPGFAGLDQINFQVPANAPLGCWVPVYVRTNGTGVSNVVTMAIQSDGSACSDAQNPFSQALVAGKNFGGFVTVRGTTREDVGTKAPVDVTGDYSGAVAYSAGSSPFPFQPLASLPPAGTCNAYSVKGDLLGGDPLPGATGAKQLDLGMLSGLTGPRGMKPMTSLFTGALAAYLGGALSNNLIPNSLYLDPGSYSITSPGGKDVGPFQASFTVPQPLTWTNRDQLTAVPRSQPLTVAWSGGASGDLVGVVGFGEDLPTYASTVFACLAPPSATSFTVPAAILANLPATRGNVLQSKSVVYLVTIPQASAAALNASGLDTGFAAASYITGKTVAWQ